MRKFPKAHQHSSSARGGVTAAGAKANHPMKKRMGLLADSEMESRNGMSLVRIGLML